MRFGQSAIAWPISSADLAIAQGTLAGMCFGGFMALDTGGSTPPFIVGDTFLKNVYSVFRANPASVGFATLSGTATAMNGQLGQAPSATVGSVATVTGGSTNTGSDRNSNAAVPSVESGALGLWLAALSAGLVGGGLLL